MVEVMVSGRRGQVLSGRTSKRRKGLHRRAFVATFASMTRNGRCSLDFAWIQNPSIRLAAWIIALMLGMSAWAESAASKNDLPPLPPTLPAAPAVKSRPAPQSVATPTVAAPKATATATNVGVIHGTTPPFAWDSDFKEIKSKPGETSAQLSFWLTNTADHPVIIKGVHPSCGCTIAEIPPTPWIINPGSNGLIKTSVDLRGKRQMVSKSVTVDTSHGYKVLTFRVLIPEPSASMAAGGADRNRNMEIAKADRQAVFRGDCAKCHAEPAAGKMGAQLYTAVCGVCHEGDHRAAFVPDLHTLKVAIGPDYWRHWITNGKPDSLMPAFSKTFGGPLTDEQIASLVDYASKNIRAPGAAVSSSPVSGGAVKP